MKPFDWSNQLNFYFIQSNILYLKQNVRHKNTFEFQLLKIQIDNRKVRQI